MDYKFETQVAKIKFEVLKEVAKSAFAGTLEQDIDKIPARVCPGPKPAYRCCIYHEREIVKERIKVLRGLNKENPNVIEVIPIACDQCPMGGYTVTYSCRGCIGHACQQACPRGAITIDDQHHAYIDKTKCINCGLCAKACPFGAIYNFRRPCQKACTIQAISIDENLSAKIDNSKCISCGACLHACPFGAINDKTQIVDIIETIKKIRSGEVKRPFYAVIAPSIASQFNPLTVNQIAEAITKLGFTDVKEAALGADLVAWEEGKELAEKGVLTSSCCPAFVDFVVKRHPELKDKVSHALSPMAAISKIIKERHPDAIICFIGPCTAKKMEIRREEVKPYVDFAMTFVELRALFAAAEIDLDNLKGIEINDATSYGRNFARCGGLADAVVQVLKELDEKEFKLLAQSCNGMAECIKAIGELSSGKSKYNFIEGMACPGGCISGAGSLNHNAIVAKALISMHGKKSIHKSVKESASRYWKK